MKKIKLALFASGNGTNVEAIICYFRHHPIIQVALVLSNNKNAYALKRAGNHGIPQSSFSRTEFYQTDLVIHQLQEFEVNWVILAGFMWLVPQPLLAMYPRTMVNIHPALLPSYGGKGMYGDHVHQAVLENGEMVSGITIHYVNPQYDEGNIIFQAKCRVKKDDTKDKLAKRVHQLEHKYYPQIIERLCQGDLQ